jgi:thiamine pyrophosphate-dependent acetolactate synthase large subunit-like protein
MVQTLRDLGIEFVAANPGSSFEGLQESIANYGDPPNRMPEFITALHEETSVDMASGYAKAEGKPMCAMLHGTIGLQHAAMAIYQAYYAGTPMLLIAGRDDGFIQAHTANDMAGIVRSFTKWDAQPTTLAGCLDALQEAYRQAITPPTGPTLVVIDIELQKQEAGELQVPSIGRPGSKVWTTQLHGSSRNACSRRRIRASTWVFCARSTECALPSSWPSSSAPASGLRRRTGP